MAHTTTAQHILPTAAPVAVATASAPSCPRRLDRRTFLRDVSLAVVGSLAVAGLVPGEAFAGPVRELLSTASRGVERTYPVPTSDGVWVDAGSGVALARVGKRLFAFSTECPHRGRTMDWIPGEQRFYCAKHKARFTSDGAHASGRRTTDLDRFALRRTNGGVVVQLDPVLTADSNAAAWAGAVLTV